MNPAERQTISYINITPSWQGIVGLLAELAVNATTTKARADAMEELQRLAKAQDDRNEEAKAGTTPVGTYAIATENSVYIAVRGTDGVLTVKSRTTFSLYGWLEAERSYSGKALADPVVGERFRFEWSEEPTRGPINTTKVTGITRI